jgi:hypothetical protein
MPGSPPLLAEATAALQAQWHRLRPWVGALVDSDVAGEPSVLDGWTTVELVVHLGRAMDALAVCTPAPPGTVPLTLAEYLGSYSGRGADISALTRDLATRHARDPLGYVDESARGAFATLDRFAGQDVVVQARRSPVLLSEMTVSRVIELVVHGDDLLRSLHLLRGADVPPDPVDPTALDLVARALLGIVVARVGDDLEVADARRWVRLATGRTPYDVDALAAALRPRYTSEGVPDLGRMLPVL